MADRTIGRGQEEELINGLLPLTPERFDLLIKEIYPDIRITGEQLFSPQASGYVPAVGPIQSNSNSSVGTETAMPTPSVTPIIIPQSAPEPSTIGPPENPSAT